MHAASGQMPLVAPSGDFHPTFWCFYCFYPEEQGWPLLYADQT